jgi:hypothetical protein
MSVSSVVNQEASLVTITLCGYSYSQRFWAFNKMGSARRDIARVAGLRFWKLLGTGQGSGFSLQPDFSRYGLLAAWESAEAADDFFEKSRLMRDYRKHAEEVWTVRLLPIQARGAWSKRNPFLPLAAVGSYDGPVAVLTRARIRFSQLIAFWKAVPATSRALEHAHGLLASIGTGEIPFTHPATFSIWRSEQDLESYAYGTAEHREVIRRRRDEGWYSEELFARFVPIASEGTWNGRDPLGHYQAAQAGGLALYQRK